MKFKDRFSYENLYKEQDVIVCPPALVFDKGNKEIGLLCLIWYWAFSFKKGKK